MIDQFFEPRTALERRLIAAQAGEIAESEFVAAQLFMPVLDDSGGIANLTDLKWIVENLGIGFGIVPNPGWDVGLELEADAVRQITDLQ